MDIHDSIISIVGISERISSSNPNRDEIIGRTSIQKLIYLTQQNCHDIDIPQFEPYFYGPYSAEVSLALGELVAYAFLDESKNLENNYKGYRYKLNENGKTAEKRIEKNFKDTYKKIAEIIKKCNEVCYLKSKPLSYASKIYYMLSEPENKKMTISDLEARGKDLGWNLSDEYLKQGISVLKKLKMINN